MRRIAPRLIPFGSFDIPGLEGWLAAMAAKGLRFQLTAGLVAWFERTQAEQVQVHLEPIRGSADEDPGGTCPL